jgi:hypothetical protein
MTGRPSWLDRAVDEALAVCPTMQPWEVRVMLIAAAPTIQNAATEAALAEAAREFESGNDWCQRALAAEAQVAAVAALAAEYDELGATFLILDVRYTYRDIAEDMHRIVAASDD